MLTICLLIVVYSIASFLCFFFFKQKTAYEMRISDWSSDVCSSDLVRQRQIGDLEPAETDEHEEGNGKGHFEHHRAAGAACEMARGDPRAAAKAEKRAHPHVSASTSPPAANGWLRSSVLEVSVVDCGCTSIFHTGSTRDRKTGV